MIQFASLPLWANLLAVAVSAVVVWFSGARLERAVEGIVRQTRLSPALAGLVLLPIAGSLPELATTISGALIGSAALITNNLLGGIAMQAAILVVADCIFRRGALTSFAPSFALLLGGVSLVLSLGFAIAVMASGEPLSFFNVGVGAFLIFCVHIALVTMTHRVGGEPRWQPVGSPKEDSSAHDRAEQDENGGAEPLWRHWGVFSGCAIAILFSGWVVMNSADAVAAQTGISESFIGATLVAIATSLPELSTVTAAVRRGHYEMAISNVFGSNLYDVSLLFVADIFFRSGPLLGSAPRQAMFTASLGLVMTCVYLWGMLERRDQAVLRVGVDSIIVLVIYLGGLAVLYGMG